MTLMMTETTRWTALATLLFLGAHLSAPIAWAQAPSMPASGAKAAGPAGSARRRRPGGLPRGDREHPLAA